MPHSFKVKAELDAIDQALDEVGAPPASSRADRVRAMGAFYQKFYSPAVPNESQVQPMAVPAEVRE